MAETSTPKSMACRCMESSLEHCYDGTSHILHQYRWRAEAAGDCSSSPVREPNNLTPPISLVYSDAQPGWLKPICGSEYKNFTSWEDDYAMHIRFDIDGSLYCCRDRVLDGGVGAGRRSKR